MKNENREIEVRFLNINPKVLIKKLQKLNAKDEGEYKITETIFYDKEKTWLNIGKFVRIRKAKDKILVSYKHHQKHTATDTVEIEFEVNDFNKARDFIESLGLVAFRIQEKKRHTFKLDNVTLDIDTWPTIPTYVEIEGESEEDLKDIAQKLDLDWKKAVFENAKIVIEKYYRVPVSIYKYFTFKKIA
ncbi:MAG: CYTH domain-containing protein [Candidatus Levybacteria bacterium]|nr:CYTH domain-containing protein [Candidatus Levybacteria bacterium]